jgi:hypothetical protein
MDLFDTNTKPNLVNFPIFKISDILESRLKFLKIRLTEFHINLNSLKE